TLLESIQLAEQQHRTGDQVSLHRYVADVYDLLGDRMHALDHYDRSVALARENHSDLEATMGMALSAMVRATEPADRAEARRQANQALASIREMHLPAAEARVLGCLARVAGLSGNQREAASFLEAALAARRRAKDLEAQPLLLAQLGQTYLTLGDRARAM